MLESSYKKPALDRFYYRFLQDCNAARFVQTVAATYSVGTLHHLARHWDRQTRRASVLALTMIGHNESTQFVGASLRDSDRAVRFIAEDGLPAMWFRVGSLEQRQTLQRSARLGAAGQQFESLQLVDTVLQSGIEYGEGWFRRATLLSRFGQHEQAIADCERALECEPCHFLASMLMASSFCELENLHRSVECLQMALTIHPHWDLARHQLRRLQRVLREQTDC